MKQHLFYRLTLLLFIFVLIFGMSGTPITASASMSDSTDLRILASDSNGLTVELIVPTILLEPSASDQGSCLLATVPNWGSSGLAGEPSLPIRGALIGIPNEQTPRVEVLAADPLPVREGLDLCPAPTGLASQSIDGSLSDGGETRLVNPEAYQINTDLPGSLIQVSSPELLRGRWVVRLTFQPFQYNPSTRNLSPYTRLKIRILFTSPTLSGYQNPAPVDTFFSGLLLNEEQASTWQKSPFLNFQPIKADFIPPAGPAVKIAVSKDGFFQVDYAALLAAGAQVDTLNPNTFRITSSAGESNLTVEGNGNIIFEPGEKVIFYGQKLNTRYTDTNTYWLTWGGAIGSRIEDIDAAPLSGTLLASFKSTAHFEQDKYYQSVYVSGTNNDHWYWDFVQATTPSSKDLPVNLPHVAASGGTAIIRGLLKGYAANPQHLTKIYINNTLVREDYWPAQGELAFESTIPQSLLMEGANVIKVECPLTGGVTLDVLFINWLEIEYTKSYAADLSQTQFNVDTAGDWNPIVPGFASADIQTWDISDPLHPLHLLNTLLQLDGTTYSLSFRQLTGGTRRYLSASTSLIPSADALTLVTPVDLRTTALDVDYLIITHPNFDSAIQPLADFHTARGLQVKVINVQDIYDNFSGGVFDPLAIRDFISYAYTHSLTRIPAYVLLVGDGNYDFKNLLARNEPNYIPPFLSMVDPWIGEVGADNRYVTMDGENDILPDLALGRLPVKTAAETSAVVNKILSYAMDSQSGNWGRSFLLVADETDPAAGDFPVLSDQLAAELLSPRGIDITKIYYKVTHPNTSSTRLAIENSINSGRGVVIYTGHSSQTQWSLDNFFDKYSLPDLNNPTHLPILISLTCYTGMYVSPSPSNNDLSALDEFLIRAPEKGVVATFSPTGKGLTEGHDILVRGMLNALFNHTTLVGPATTAAKVYLYGASAGNHELIDTFVLFGDPAMRYPIDPTAVNLNYFRASKGSGGVQLAWETISEAEIVGFHLWRAVAGSGDFVKINTELITALAGGVNEGRAYTFLDTAASPEIKYEYRLDLIKNNLQVLYSKTAIYWPHLLQLPLIQN